MRPPMPNTKPSSSVQQNDVNIHHQSLLYHPNQSSSASSYTATHHKSSLLSNKKDNQTEYEQPVRIAHPPVTPSASSAAYAYDTRRRNSSSSGWNDFDKDNDLSQFQLVNLSSSPPSAYNPYRQHHHYHDQQSILPDRSSSSLTQGDSHYYHHQAQQRRSNATCTTPTSLSSPPGSNFYSATNSFDENFLIFSRAAANAYESENHLNGFPESPNHQNEIVSPSFVNRPLSETEPLLTNIEATVTEPDRAICLNKNSASLIFTKKDLAAVGGAVSSSSSSLSFRHRRNSNSNSSSTSASTNNNRNQSSFGSRSARRSSNADRRVDYYNSTSAKIGASAASGSVRSRNRHHSLRAVDRRKQQQQQHKQHQEQHQWNQQQHRYSLPLNYSHDGNAYSNAFVSVSNSINNNNNNYRDSIGGRFEATVHRSLSSSNTTAATTRKQHAYSWYAPVYSALEEELEQDSRDSSPIHNLANAKKHHNSAHHQHHQVGSSLVSSDNETASLLESKNHINIQPPLNHYTATPTAAHRRTTSSPQPPSTLSLTNTHSPASIVGGGLGGLSSGGANNQQQFDAEGPHAGSLLAGGPLPRRRRFENFLKSLVGRKSSTAAASKDINSTTTNNSAPIVPLLPSPEITITRTPSEQNVILRDPSGGGGYAARKCRQSTSFTNFTTTSDKIASPAPPAGSTSSLNATVQQKLWNVVPLLRREGSATSLHNEKSHSIVQYTGLRKCETVLALTRQSSSICSPVLGIGPGIVGGAGCHGGSGIYSASGVEQIRPLNRLRNSISTSNATCSRCSSLLSLGASESRYSLNMANSSGFVNVNHNASSGNKPNHHNHHQQQNNYHHYHHHHHNRVNNSTLSNSNLSSSNSVISKSKSDLHGNSARAIVGIGTGSGVISGICSRKSSAGANSNHSASSSSGNSPPSNITTATLNSSATSSTPTTPTATVVDAPSSGVAGGYPPTVTSLLSMSSSSSVGSASQQNVEMFTCKLCLLDVSTSEATTLSLCGCRFCTECMKAYVEFEISEGAYEISCPDAQCPAQGIIAISEIANLTSANLMKKHHRYRLNREIELDKSRTWCPRAGCETVCLVGTRPPAGQGASSDLPSSSSSSFNAGLTPISLTDKDDLAISQILCAVQCPSCKDEFCSACKKTWHPNITCEENSRRLVADGQDDIGIPFDNDLIKCCPMCAVPIEKDEGCAQMMCKRCKHVFCWYCLASLDDDFLLRHYDKGPCKNKLGHSRASVVWHRAQVIGIFAGFGILLLVASPLLLLAAPCIICCKCRICSGGAKMEDPETDMEEATALHS